MLASVLHWAYFPRLVFSCFLCAAIIFWNFRALKRTGSVNLWPFILAQIALIVIWNWSSHIDMDEVEHLHSSWLVSQGLVPFRDFWQHHSPLLWIILSPIMKVVPQNAGIFDLSRLIAALVFTVIGMVGWSIIKRTWGKEGSKEMYLLLLASGGILGQYLFLRPDLFMVLFILLGIRVSLDIPGERYLPSFLAGVSFALAVSFVLKQYFVCFLPFIIMLVERHPRMPRKFILCLAGFIVGFLPLICYLAGNHILPDFFFWVLEFNRKQAVFSGFFIRALFFIGAWGVIVMLARYRKNHDLSMFALSVTFVLSALSSCLGKGFGLYYLTGWQVIASIAGSGIVLWNIPGKVKSLVFKAIVSGVLISLLLLPQIMYCNPLHRTSHYPRDKYAFAKIMEYCRDGTSLTILPWNPVFAFDATRLYGYWQYTYLDRYSFVRDDLVKDDFMGSLISRRPAIISCTTIIKEDLILGLCQKKLVSAEECTRLTAFLKENYTVTKIGETDFYLRNDLIKLN